MPSPIPLPRKVARAGVSFLELTVSVTIIGILAAIASPVYSNSLMRYRTEAAVQRIVQDIVQTERVARQTNSIRTIAFTLSDHSYLISGIHSLDRVSQPYKVSLGMAPYHTQLASLATATQPATELPNVTLAFDRFGMPDQGIVIKVGLGAYQKQVEVAATTGRVSVQ